MNPTTFRSVIAAPMLAVLPLSPAAASDVVAVPIAGRLHVFEIDDAGAESTRARRLNARASAVVNGRLAGVEGRRPAVLDGGWSLTGTVLVRAANAEALRLAVGQAGPAPRAIPGLPGWFEIDTGRVGTAAVLASRLMNEPGVGAVELDVLMPIATRDVPNDPFFSLQWPLLNTFLPGVDARVADAWGLGYTGQGVTICIVESFGFQMNHPDLAPNINVSISQPTVFVSTHMTNVAGVAAAAGNNGIGVAGAAYNADLSQALIGSNQQIASALLLLNNFNDIKNNSWGPTDNGRIDPMPEVVDAAIIESIATGRNGLGEIFVWAGGNGRSSSDRVDYDPYASSRYTIAVAAVGDNDRWASYSEPGSSLLISGYSDGGSLGITTTTSGSNYTFNFGGTSAAAPLVAGIVALMLEANPGLTWRDVQHILVDSARLIDPDSEGWGVNGSGRLFNDDYGFGMVDALTAVILAENWVGVEPERTVSTGVVTVDQPVPDGSVAGIEIPVFISDSVQIESVELVLNLDSDFVGELDISITSPGGTRSILARRRNTDPQTQLVNTVFTSKRHWGERSEGTWLVKIVDRFAPNQSHWHDFELRFHGVDLGPGPCSPFDLAEPYGVLDLADVNAFVTAYLAGDPAADLAAPFGVLDEDDITAFVLGFPQGCD